MERAGIAARIVALMEALTSSMTGGLAIATVAVATFWGAVSGSGPATVAALGLILIPGMVKAGYAKDFAAATVSVTSGLAIVIPPQHCLYRLWWHCKCFCSGAVCGRFRARNCCSRLHNACRLSYLAQKRL